MIAAESKQLSAARNRLERELRDEIRARFERFRRETGATIAGVRVKVNPISGRVQIVEVDTVEL